MKHRAPVTYADFVKTIDKFNPVIQALILAVFSSNGADAHSFLNNFENGICKDTAESEARIDVLEDVALIRQAYEGMPNSERNTIRLHLTKRFSHCSLGQP